MLIVIPVVVENAEETAKALEIGDKVVHEEETTEGIYV